MHPCAGFQTARQSSCTSQRYCETATLPTTMSMSPSSGCREWLPPDQTIAKILPRLCLLLTQRWAYAFSRRPRRLTWKSLRATCHRGGTYWITDLWYAAKHTPAPWAGWLCHCCRRRGALEGWWMWRSTSSFGLWESATAELAFLHFCI